MKAAEWYEDEGRMCEAFRRAGISRTNHSGDRRAHDQAAGRGASSEWRAAPGHLESPASRIR